MLLCDPFRPGFGLHVQEPCAQPSQNPLAPSPVAAIQPGSEDLLEKLEPQLPPEDFSAAIERGKNLDLETVVKELLEESDEVATE